MSDLESVIENKKKGASPCHMHLHNPPFIQ